MPRYWCTRAPIVSVVAALAISAGDATVLVDPGNGGRVTSLNVRGTEVISGAAAGLGGFEWGLYPMVPFAGRIRDGVLRHRGSSHQLPRNAPPHAMHGYAHDAEWRIFDKSDSAIVMRLELAPPWPFRGVVFHTVSVQPWKVRFELSLAARDEMPAQVGWHPWFARPCEASFEFGAMYERGADGIPTGRLVKPRAKDIDDCFADPLADPAVRFGDDLRVTLHSNCSHWVVFDGREHGICIEPQSGPPNGPNDSPHLVAAGSELRRWFEIRW